MVAKTKGVLSKYPSEMTAEEKATWDALVEANVTQIIEAVHEHEKQLQAIQDAFERQMFDAGLWTYHSLPIAQEPSP